MLRALLVTAIVLLVASPGGATTSYETQQYVAGSHGAGGWELVCDGVAPGTSLGGVCLPVTAGASGVRFFVVDQLRQHYFCAPGSMVACYITGAMTTTTAAALNQIGGTYAFMDAADQSVGQGEFCERPLGPGAGTELAVPPGAVELRIALDGGGSLACSPLSFATTGTVYAFYR